MGMTYSVSTEDWHSQIQALEKSLAAKKKSLETTYMAEMANPSPPPPPTPQPKALRSSL